MKHFLITSFFLSPITLIAQTDDIEGKLKAQEEQKKIEDTKTEDQQIKSKKSCSCC